MNVKTVYKIRNGQGLFSMGGISPVFNKKGKTWTKLGYVKVHLDAFKSIPEDWQIVELTVITKEEEKDLGPAKSYHTKGKGFWQLDEKHWPAPAGLVKGSVEWSDWKRKEMAK